MFERLSVPSRQAIVRGHNECQKIADGQPLNSGHLLVGLAGRSGDQAQRALSSVGLSPKSLELHLAKRSKSFEPGFRGALAGELRTVISSAVERRQPKLCILNTEDSIGLMVLTDAGVDVAELRHACLPRQPRPTHRTCRLAEECGRYMSRTTRRLPRACGGRSGADLLRWLPAPEPRTSPGSHGSSREKL